MAKIVLCAPSEAVTVATEVDPPARVVLEGVLDGELLLALDVGPWVEVGP